MTTTITSDRQSRHLIFETTTEYLINFIKNLFDYGNDIGTALKFLEPMNA